VSSVVFLGNCQAQAVSHAYSRFVAPARGDRVDYVPSYRETTPEQKQLVAEADIVVELLMDFEQPSGLDNSQLRGKRYFIPLVSGGWLWPNHGTPHPHSQAKRFHVGQMIDCADAFLNKMIIEGVQPEKAADRYMELRPSDFRGLDRRYEIMMEKQRQRDDATGYRTADFIEAHFREESTFLTPFHPTLPLARYVVLSLLQDMGIETEHIARVERFMGDSFYPRLEVPIHPAVAEHFGLSFIAPNKR